MPTEKVGPRLVIGGALALVALLATAGAVLLLNLPDARAFDARVERLFIDNADLTGEAEIRLLEILAQSGNTFADTLASYRFTIFVLMVFAAALLALALVFLLVVAGQNRRLAEIDRAGIAIRSLALDREGQVLQLNGMEFRLTAAIAETLAALCEARLDDEVLSGAELEAVITGKAAAECDEAAGAVRIKRLRDQLGGQLMAELLIRNVTRKGYTLAVEKSAIRLG